MGILSCEITEEALLILFLVFQSFVIKERIILFQILIL